MGRRTAVIILCGFTVGQTMGQGLPNSEEKQGLPTVVLIGDSIRLSYASVVTKRLDGKAVVVSPQANGGDSSNVLKHLERWGVQRKPTVVHFNCGIHDTKKFKATGKFQVSPAQYEANLKKIVQQIRAQSDAFVIFATTTPLIDSRAAAARKDRNYELLNDSVVLYNKIAMNVMAELKVPVNDVYTVLSKPAPPLTTGSLVGSDGVHLTLPAQQLVGERVVTVIEKHLGR